MYDFPPYDPDAGVAANFVDFLEVFGVQMLTLAALGVTLAGTMFALRAGWSVVQPFTDPSRIRPWDR